jgi:hypothetical protein
VVCSEVVVLGVEEVVVLGVEVLVVKVLVDGTENMVLYCLKTKNDENVGDSSAFILQRVAYPVKRRSPIFATIRSEEPGFLKNSTLYL